MQTRFNVSHRLATRWRAALGLGAALCLVGLRLGFLESHGSHVPAAGEWLTEAEGLYRPWLHRAPDSRGLLDLITTHPDPGARALKLLCVVESGQWDPLLLGVVAAAVFGLAASALFGLLLRSTPTTAAFAVAVCGGLFLGLPCVLGTAPDPSQSWAALLLLFSSLHLAGAAFGRPSSRRWWGGHLAGLLSVASSAAGLASPLAVLLWSLMDSANGGARKRGRLFTVLWNALLATLGVARLWAIHSRTGLPLISLSLLLKLGAWPLEVPAGAIVVWAPSLAFLIMSLCRRTGRPRESRTQLAVLWVLSLGVILSMPAANPGHDVPRVLAAAGLVVQLLAATAITFGSRGLRTAKVVLATAWLIVVLGGFFGRSDFHPDVAREEASRTAQVNAVSGFLADRKVDDLEPVAEGRKGDRDALASLLSDDRIEAILPPPIRAPLPLVPGSGSTGFRPDAIPALAGKPRTLPAWGNWSQGGASLPGTFTGGVLHPGTSMVQVYVAGALDPPYSTLELKSADGRSVAPLERRVEAGVRWKLLNFPPLSGPFQLVAKAADGRHRLAFTAPLEVSRASWIAGKVATGWIWVLGLGGVLLGVSAWGSSRAGNRLARPGGLSETAEDLARYAPALGLLAYALFMSHFIDHYAGGSDASGYLNSAKLLMDGHLTLPGREIPGISASRQLLAPLGYVMSAGAITPWYPVGLPLLFAAVGRVASLEVAVPIVVMAHLLLGICLTFLLARACGLSRAASWIAAAVIAWCPLYVFMGLQPMSDVPSLAWVTAALYLAVSSRGAPRRAAWSGLACGVAVLLRPANLACLVPAALVLAPSLRRLAYWVLGGSPVAVFLAWYNQHLYGSPFRTGYLDAPSLFQWHWVPQSAHNYWHWIPAYLTPFVCLAVIAPFVRLLGRPARVALPACVLLYFGIHAFYRYTHESWWYLRFILPAFPCLVVLAVAGWNSLLDRVRLAGALRRAAVVAILGVFASNTALLFSRLPILYSWRGTKTYRDVCLWIEENTPKDAVVAAFQASGALYYYTDHPLIRTEGLTHVEAARVIDQLSLKGRPVYAVIVPYDGMTPLSRLPGLWKRVAAVQDAEVWRLQPCQR